MNIFQNSDIQEDIKYISESIWALLTLKCICFQYYAFRKIAYSAKGTTYLQ